ncbi:sugar porter family MFS transporter [Temperatibacter marinus]|uniref:Sugar porter family MFS transporter n=1 Tax=Temperatibacter marinus TaxID=1456591 RepID=A0AA52EEZ4_9PROT|nr:sugar porter family MFS transporter [Temperatibacter marinus]WND03571.1 sugar porter family MFS transporter [Temperatibacter marinus]
MTTWARTALLYAIFVSLGGFVFGYDASVIAGVVGFVKQEFALNDYQLGLVVSAPTFTATLAALTVTPLADRFGRKNILMMLAFLYLLSAIYSAFAPDYINLVIARMIGGYAFGSLMLAPVFIAETSPSDKRGLMVSVNQLNIVVGLSAAYFVNYFLLNAADSGEAWASALYIDSHTWRVMLFIESIPAALWFLLLFLIPESPRWLVKKGREQQAKSVLHKIVDPARIETSYQRIVDNLQDTQESLKDNLKGLFASKMRFILLIGVLLAVVQQATGINAVFFYAPTIFEQSGVGTDAAFIQAVYVGLINVVFTVIAMLLIDRLGRKPLMVIGLAGVMISLLTTAYGFSKATFTLEQEDVLALSDRHQIPAIYTLTGKKFDSDVTFKEAVIAVIGDDKMRSTESDIMNRAITINAQLVLIGILGFVASFAISLGPVMWVMLSEIFPNNLRAVAMAFTGVFNSGTSFLVQFLFPKGLSTFGAATMFSVYGAFAILGLLLVIKYLPETKGKSLEELEDALVNNRS